MPHLRSVSAIGLVLVVAATTGACSGSASGSGSGSGSSGGSSATASSTGPRPAPTESNPPGDIPDNQAFVSYRPSPGAFRAFTVKVPEGWARTGRGPVAEFRDKLNSIRISAASNSSAPTADSVRTDVVAQLKDRVPKFGGPKVTTVSRHAGHVVLLTYEGDSAADPVTGKVVRDAFERYAFYGHGHEVDLTLSGPVNADNVDPWRIVSDSFAWK
ncbi:hypothetical protein ACFV99_15240 [Streptomyces sp. NPDC059944]|uniref:hypothetical protein n=1 Tax=unclassified Streptomyces TaxID=2593676 RepID=UPI00365E0749